MADGKIRANDLLEEKALLIFKELQETISANVKEVERLKQASIHLGNITMKTGQDSLAVQELIKENTLEILTLRKKEIRLEEQYLGIKKKLFSQDASARAKADAQIKSESAAKKKLRDREIADLKAMAALRAKMEIAGNKAWKNAVKFRETQRNKETAAIKKAEKARSAARMKAIGLITAAFFILQRVTRTIGQAFDAIADKVILLDSFSKLMFRVTGSTYEAAESMDFLIDVSKRFGISLEAATQRYAKFFAAAKQAGLGTDEVRLIFEKVAKVSGVLGLKTDELGGVFLALEQMLSKGKVTTEELRRQLGERLPGAFGIMAKAVDKLNPDMVVTVRNMDALLKSGAILSAEVLPEFARQLEIAFNAMDITRVETVIAAQERSKNSYIELIREIDNGSGVLSQAVIGWYEFKNAMLESLTMSNRLTDATDEQKAKIRELTSEMLEAQNRLKGLGLDILFSKSARDEALQNLEDRKFALAEYEEKVSKIIIAKRLEKLIDQDLKLLMKGKLLDAGLLVTEEQKLMHFKQLNLLLDSLTLKEKEDLLKVYKDINKLQSGEEDTAEVGSLDWFDKKISFMNKELKAEVYLENANSKKIKQLIIIRDLYKKQREELAKLLGLGSKSKGDELTPRDEAKGVADISKGIFTGNQDIADLEKQAAVFERIAKASSGSVADDYQRMATGIRNVISELSKLDNSSFDPDGLGLPGVIPGPRQTTNPLQWLEDNQEVIDAAIEGMNQLFNISTALAARQVENLQAEIRATEDMYSRKLELARGDDENIKAIEREKEVRLAKLKARELKARQKEAKLSKAQAVTNATINTAIAITKALGQPWLIALVAAAGAAQIASIIATPIPQYKEGRDGGPAEMAIVGDGGVSEWILGKRGISRTPNKPTLTRLSKGDSVIKDDKALQQVLYQALLKDNNIKFSRDNSGIERAVINGLKKAKVNNFIKMPNIEVKIDHEIWLNNNSQFGR